MAFMEEYLFWKVAEFLVDKQQYRFLKLSKDHKELWLEKTESKQVQIVRLLQYDLDWSNWLQRDIEATAQNGDRIRKQLMKGEIKLLNLYFSAYPPVDDYAFRLESPYTHPETGKVEVTSFLVDRSNGQETVKGLEGIFGEDLLVDLAVNSPDSEIDDVKNRILAKVVNKAKAERAVFSYGKPFFTYIFIAIQILMFLVLEVSGGSTNTKTLIEYGAKFNPLLLEGEWWRFFTPVFLHIGILHLVMNTLALYYLGTLVERLYGNIRFLFIYLAAGFGGTLASFLLSPNLSAGASGAIFGCFGALLYFGVINPRLFWRTLGLNIFIVLAINLAFGFSVPGIDNAGHIGGLIGGFAFAGIVHLPNKKRTWLQPLFFLVSGLIVFFLLQFGFSEEADLVDERSILVAAQQYIIEEDYQKAYELLDTYGTGKGETAETLFLLSFTEIKLGSMEEAKNHLLKVVDINPDFHEAYYNLALVYLEEKEYKEAQKHAIQAVDLKPDQSEYQKTLEQINRYLEAAALK